MNISFKLLSCFLHSLWWKMMRMTGWQNTFLCNIFSCMMNLLSYLIRIDIFIDNVVFASKCFYDIFFYDAGEVCWIYQKLSTIKFKTPNLNGTNIYMWSISRIITKPLWTFLGSHPCLDLMLMMQSFRWITIEKLQS